MYVCTYIYMYMYITTCKRRENGLKKNNNKKKRETFINYRFESVQMCSNPGFDLGFGTCMHIPVLHTQLGRFEVQISYF